MSERQDILKKARERMIEDRDAHAKVLAAPSTATRPNARGPNSSKSSV